jgi:DNA-binding MarR family transcriptional regulator
MTDFFAIVALHRQLIHRTFARYDLHPAQAVCILALSRRDQITQSELAEELLLTRPSVTRLLQRMERAGLIHRQIDATDQRQVRVSLTEAGREVQHVIRRAGAEYARRTVALLPDAERADLARILPAWRKLAEQEARS